MNLHQKPAISALAISVLLLTLACSGNSRVEKLPETRAAAAQIAYGIDLCAFSNEVIETVRYGGRIVMKDGVVRHFMSVECVAGFYLNLEDKSAVESIEIVDFAQGKQLLPAEDLVYLRSSLRPSPNGLFLTAVDASNEKMKTYIYDAYPGEYMEWDQVIELVHEAWFRQSD